MNFLTKFFITYLEAHDYKIMPMSMYSESVKAARERIKKNVKLTAQNKKLKEAMDDLYATKGRIENAYLEVIADIDAYTETFENSPTKYRMRGKLDYLHTIFDDFDNDKATQDLYLDFLDTEGFLDLEFNDSDRLVYLAVNKLNGLLRHRYVHDKQEHWYTPKEALLNFDKKTSFDCDDYAIFMHCCLYVLGEHFNLDLPLLRVDIKMYAPKGIYGHAVVAYQNLNQKWIKIETSLWSNRFPLEFAQEKEIFKSCYLDIWHIFDMHNEFKIKHK